MPQQAPPRTATLMLSGFAGEVLSVCVAHVRQLLPGVAARVAAGETDLGDRCAVRMMSQEGLTALQERLDAWEDGSSILLELNESEVKHLACCVNHFKSLVEDAEDGQYENPASQAWTLDLLTLTLGQLDLALHLLTGEGYAAWAYAVAAQLEGQVVS